MKKFLQDNGPSQVWIQTWISGAGMEAQPAEPLIWPEMDDWQAQLFNYYFLTSFSTETNGKLDSASGQYPEMESCLNAYFQEGGLTAAHSFFSEKWAKSLPSCDEDACWFTAVWDTFVLDDYEGKAIGFFFSNERKSFLSVGDGEANVMRGLPLQKPEYGLLCLPMETGEFRLFVVEPGGSTALRTSWTLGLFPFLPMYEDSFHAKQFFKMCKSFSEDVLVKEQHKPRENQVAFLSESLDYASRKGEIDLDKFKTDVLKEPSVVDAFENYQEKYTETKGWNPPDRFAMTDQDHNQARKFVKSVIKLDKNFHIYVHGSKDRIEKGFDENRKLNFYTLWFDSEA